MNSPVQNPTPQHELEAAYYSGLRNFAGDPEVAEDLGITYSPESFDAHLEASQKVAEVLDREHKLAKVVEIFPGAAEANPKDFQTGPLLQPGALPVTMRGLGLAKQEIAAARTRTTTGV